MKYLQPVSLWKQEELRFEKGLLNFRHSGKLEARGALEVIEVLRTFLVDGGEN